jgi:hypothetical protein
MKRMWSVMKSLSRSRERLEWPRFITRIASARCSGLWLALAKEMFYEFLCSAQSGGKAGNWPNWQFLVNVKFCPPMEEIFRNEIKCWPY